MREVVKNYNFCEFDFKFEEDCVSRNKLTIKECVNVSLNANTFMPSFDYNDLFISMLGKENYELFSSKYFDIINSFIYITCFDYFDDQLLEYNNFYLLLDNEYNLYKLTIYDTDINLIKMDIKFNKMPFIFANNGKIYFYSKKDNFIYFEDNNTVISVSNFIDLESYCNYQNLSFFVSANDIYKIYYSEKIDIENINEDLSFYNYISVDKKYGKILDVVMLKNNLYVIQQFAISRIWFVSDEIYLYSNCSINAKILKSTICRLNDYLIFYSTAGLFLFDGNQVNQIFSEITNKISFGDKKATVFNNKYFLSTQMNIINDNKNVIIEFDLNKNCFTIHQFDKITDLYTIQSNNHYNLVALNFSNNEYKLLTYDMQNLNNKHKYIKFNKITFDDNLLKSIMNLKIISEGNYFIKISSEISQKLITVNGNLNIANLGISGYAFDIEIYSENYFKLKSMIFSIQTNME